MTSPTMSITSANSVFMLAIGGIYPVPQQIQNFAADSMFAIDAVDMAEVIMGVDAKMAAGWVPSVKVQTITLMANSPSILIFNNWILASSTAREIFVANATIYLPSVGQKYALTNGVLTNGKVIPDAKKMLQPVEYKISWESVLPALA